MTPARTVRDFVPAGDPWPVVDQWVQAQGYRLIEQSGVGRRYQKGSGFWVAPRMLEVSSQGDHLHLEAWVKNNALVRVMSLGILPAEIGIESGGVKAVIPRKMGRDEVNTLLTPLGQQPIT